VEILELSSSSSEDENIDMDNDNANIEISVKPIIPTIRGKTNIITPKVFGALDKCKLSDRDDVHIFVALSEALGHDINDLIINRSSIRRCRMNLRQEKADIIKNKFKEINLNAVVLHWDGKLLPALTGKNIIDRLSVIITNGDVEKIVAIPVLE